MGAYVTKKYFMEFERYIPELKKYDTILFLHQPMTSGQPLKIVQRHMAHPVYLRVWQNWQLKAAEDPKLGGALLSKEHTLYLSFLGPNNPSLSSPKFGSCQCVLCQCGTILLNHY